MKLSNVQIEKINGWWEKYKASGYLVQTPKGVVFPSKEFDSLRLRSIEDIKEIIARYASKSIDLKTFKSELDGYNKKNNLWGFAAMKGQMFFNQLWNSSQGDIGKLDNVIRECIQEPKNLSEAKEKIAKLESYVCLISETVEDKRKTPKAGSIAYFLSYFWQISNPEKYPIIYTSLTRNLESIGLWQEFEDQAKAYEIFFITMDEVRAELEKISKTKLHHWDVEHCFWRDTTDTGIMSPAKAQPNLGERTKKRDKDSTRQTNRASSNTEFDLTDYLPPVVADLHDAGQREGDTRAIKGTSFERKVAALFRMLDFDVAQLGQGKGREPDGILTFRQENIAFIYDAKVRVGGYSVGTDDRAMREYIAAHIPTLEKQGYKKLGFLIVSSRFNGNPQDAIDSLTLDTPIKRVAFVTSGALLRILAHKLCNGFPASEVAYFLLQNGIISDIDVDEHFADV